MKRAIIVSLVIGCLGATTAAEAACTKDTDCKGTRICEAGSCITPKGPLAAPRSTVGQLLRSRPPAPASAGIAINASATQAQLTQNAGPPTWHGSYAAAFTVLSMKAWGGITELASIDLSESAEGGVHLAGYHTFGPGLHLGGYLSYVSSELNAHLQDEEGDHWTLMPLKENDLGLGLALKIGGLLGPRSWLGAAIDLGLVFNGDAMGPQVFAGLNMDLLAVGHGTARLAFSFRFGPQFQFFFSDRTLNNGENLKVWKVRLMAQLGITLGA